MFYLKNVIFSIGWITGHLIIYCVGVLFFAFIFCYFGDVVHADSYTPPEMWNKIQVVQSNYDYWHEQEVQADNDFKNSLRGTDTNEQQDCLNAKKECERNARNEKRMLNILTRNYHNNIFSDQTEPVLGKRTRD